MPPGSAHIIRGRANIIAFRSSSPAAVTFEMKRITGRQDLWVKEYTMRYDGERPHHSVGIMEFRDDQVVRERIYLTEPWEPPAWRSYWVELMS